MRIVLFPSAYAPAVGGVEILTQQLAAVLAGQGHTVEVWTNRHPSELPATSVVDGITVRRFLLPLPTARLRKALLFAPRALRAALNLGRATRAFAPDVLHVQCFSSNGVYASAVSALYGVPTVISLQGETFMDDHDIYERSITLRTSLRQALRRAHAVTACSRCVLDDAEQRFGLSATTGHVVPNGVVARAGVLPMSLELPFGHFILGLGRVVEKKGFDLLLEAFARVAPRHTDVGLVIGGDGAARAPLQARVRQLGLSDRVCLPGVLSRAQIAWAMQHAETFILPSRIEPFGIVVLEALQAGLPVIVSAHGGAADIVRGGKDGLVVDPYDSDALAKAIERVLDDGALRSRLRRVGPERSRDFLWESIAEQYTALYPSPVSASRTDSA